MMMIMTIMLLINMMLMLMKHPLSMGMLLIMQTLLTSMMTGLLMNSFWMSYILLITMLSGALVLFIYMSSIASNEKFSNNMMLWSMAMITIIMGMMFLFLEEKMIIKNNYLGMEMSQMFYLNKMFNMENLYITIMLVMYLLWTMIVASSLVNIFEGPMRMKM
uniref:NADH dehydrogenase subunit 6 n=1 Tax=Apolygus lucorum TaxID=248454 RepID=A0A342LEU2_APOLU|nr:NADH dehydrogenase subunit 6 [Apolygus lucorum]